MSGEPYGNGNAPENSAAIVAYIIYAVGEVMAHFPVMV
jgi:hypothetical protein